LGLINYNEKIHFKFNLRTYLLNVKSLVRVGRNRP